MQDTDSIDEMIQQLLEKYKGADSSIMVLDAQADLIEQVRRNPTLMNPEEWVSGRFATYKKKHGFKDGDDNQEVFGFAINPDGLVILKEGRQPSWIKYKDIRRQHIPLRQSLITKKAADTMNSLAAEMAHWNNILAKWDSKKDKTLGDFIDRNQT